MPVMGRLSIPPCGLAPFLLHTFSFACFTFFAVVVVVVVGTQGNKGNMKTALKKVEKVLNGPRGAKEELAKLTYPEGDSRFEALVKALEHVSGSWFVGALGE